jgi:outer membrane protein TolC
MMGRRWWALLLLAGVLWGVHAEELEDAAQPGAPLVLAPGRVAALALAHDEAVRRAALASDVAAGELRTALARFDPVLFGSARYQREKPSPGPDTEETEDAASAFLGLLSGSSSSSKSDRTVLDLGLRLPLRTGAKVELRYTSERQRDLSEKEDSTSLFSFFSVMGPTWTNRLRLQIEQPLLQGMGFEVNQAEIRTAEIGRELALLELRDAQRRAVGAALAVYWELVQALADAEIADGSLQRSRRILTLTQERRAQGLTDELDVVRAEAGVDQRIEPTIEAARLVRGVEDRLKQLILPADRPFAGGRRLLPTATRPAYGGQQLDLAALLAVALERRGDVLLARGRVEQAEIAVRKARNALLPRADLVAGYGVEGRGTRWAGGNDQLVDTRYRSWDVGFSVEVPLGNRAARGNLQSAHARLEQLQIDLFAVEERIVVEVRAAARDMAAALRRIETARIAAARTQLLYEAEVAATGAGNKNALDAEEQLAQVKRRELQAVIAYQLARVRLAEACDTLVELAAELDRE